MKSLLTKALACLLIVCLLAPFQLFVYDDAVYATDEQSYPALDSVKEQDEAILQHSENIKPHPLNLSQEAKSKITSDLQDSEGVVKAEKLNMLAAATGPVILPEYSYVETKGDQAPFTVQLDHEVISTISGSLTVRESEMSLPGRNGLGFTLTRTYDSSASQFGQMVYDDGNTVITPFEEDYFPIGKGWSWNIPYISIGSRYQYIHLGDKGTYKYDSIKNELVDYPWKDLTFASTETNINGQTAVFVLTNLERKKLFFDSGGRLIQITDSRGNAINFYYSSYTYGGALSRITDSIGNSINISYNSSEVVISKGNETIIYYKVNQNGKELLSQVRDSMGRLTTYDYSIRNARFNLNDTSPDYMNPYALLTGVTHPTGAKSVYSYEMDPVKRFLSGPLEVNQFYRISSREDQVINSDNSISVSNRKNFSYAGDMGSTYNDIEAFSTTIQDGLGTTEFVNKKDYIDSNIGTVYYNTRIVQTATHPKTSLISKNTTTFTHDMASRNPNPIKTDIIKSVVGNSSVFKTSMSAAYNQYGNVTSSTDVNGTTTIFQYDTNHLLTGVSVPVSTNPTKIQYTEYQRDPNYLNITATRIREGGTTGSILRESVNTAYDSFGNATSTQILRDSGLYTTIVTEYSPQAPYYGAFPTGQQINTTDAEGNNSIIRKKYEYDSTNGRLIAYIDPMNQVTRYNYDPIGRVTDVIHPDNSMLTLRYLDIENQVVRTDETGVTIRTTWNPLGWKTYDGIVENGVYKNKATYEYDQYGRLKNSYDALGKKTIYDYDQWSRQSAITYPDLNTDSVFYDDIANTKTITTPVTSTENYVVKDSYDILGRLIAREETKKIGNTTKTTPLLSYTYDLMGNILTAVDAQANMTTFRYDVLGQLQSVTNQAPVTSADGKITLTPQITSFLYNQFGKMTQMTYPDNNSKRHVYDEAGRLIKTIDAKDMQEIFFYDGNSNLVRYLDRKGNRFKNTYSNRNLLVKKEIVDGAWASISGEQPISYTYDVAGRRTMMTDSTGNTKYAYDYTKGTLAAVAFPDGRLITYDYDINGNRILMNDPYGGKTIYHYDIRNRLDLIGTSSDLTNDYEVKYEYYHNGMLKQILQKNGVSANYAYDGLLTNNVIIRKADGAVLQSYGYTYDNNGNQISKTENGVNFQFTYDQMNRIETSQQFSEKYGYDIRGNRSFMSTNYPFERPDAKTSFDPYNQLTSIQTAEGTDIEYKYNGDGLLWERVENGETTRYYWDGSNIAAEANVVGGTAIFKARYIRGRGPVARQDEQGIAYFVQNGHGDVVNLVDATGMTKLNTYEYDIFGNIVSQNETIRQPFKYSGEFWDDSSKLQYLRARWYDPSIGRFISEDTYEGDITNPLSLNLYTYVGNNPLKYSDPTGHRQIEGAYADYDPNLTYEGVMLNANGYYTGESTGSYHDFLDYVGLIPVVGDWADGINAVAYLLEGEYAYALLSSGAMVPIVGWAATTSKAVVRTGEAVADAEKILDKASVFKSACNCFVGGTRVQTDDGEKNIEDIEVGDKVLSKDENNPDGELAYKEVVGLYRNQRDDIIKLHVGEQIIETTDNHPFWVEGKGWVFADELEVGNKLQKADGSNLTIDKVESVKLDEKVTVYNFTVADYHTYYVTDIGIWVHNTQCMSSASAAKVISNADRSSTALTKSDPGHRAASFLTEAELAKGTTFNITGGDGVQRTLLQVNGGLDESTGIYEYIIDANGTVSHQRFIDGGIINGIPNQRAGRR